MGGSSEPGFLLSLLWRRVTAWGLAAGTIVGVVGVTHPPAENLLQVISFEGNIGFTAFVANFVIVVLASLVTRAPKTSAMNIGVLEPLSVPEQRPA